jgi:hypothetical protein
VESVASITCISEFVVGCSRAFEYETKQADTAELHNFKAFQLRFILVVSLGQEVLSDTETVKQVCCVT